MMKKALALAALVSLCSSCRAQNKVTFFNIKQNDPQYSIEIILDGAPTGNYATSSNYRIAVKSSASPDATWRLIDLSSVTINVDQHMVDIVPKHPEDIKQAPQLMLMVGDNPGVYPTPVPNPNSGVAKGTDKTSDVYVSFSYSPGINTAAQFSIDTSVGLLFPIERTGSPNLGALGFLAAVKTDKRPSADPDSYRFFGVYQRGLTQDAHWPLQGVLFTWLVGGAEFERKANNLNFVSSPLLDFPIRLRGRIANSKQIVPVLIPEIGVEVGDNFRNAVNVDGQGVIARGVLGGNLSVNFNPKMKLFQSIHLTSAYKLRLPAKAEVFTNTTTNSAGTTVDVPFLSTKPRHYIKNELGFTLWDPLSFTVTHQYGDIPPAFRMVDHTVTIGFTVAIQRKAQMGSGLTGK